MKPVVVVRVDEYDALKRHLNLIPNHETADLRKRLDLAISYRDNHKEDAA